MCYTATPLAIRQPHSENGQQAGRGFTRIIPRLPSAGRPYCRTVVLSRERLSADAGAQHKMLHFLELAYHVEMRLRVPYFKSSWQSDILVYYYNSIQ